MKVVGKCKRTKHRMTLGAYNFGLKVLVNSGEPQPITKTDENNLIQKNLHLGHKTAAVWRSAIDSGTPVYLSVFTLAAFKEIMCDDDYKAFLAETSKPVPPVKVEAAAGTDSFARLESTSAAAAAQDQVEKPVTQSAAEKPKMTPEERKAYEIAIAVTRPMRRLTLLRLGEIKQEIKDASGVAEVTSNSMAKYFGGHFSGIQIERWIQAAKIDNPHTMQPHVYGRYVRAIADAKEKLAKLPKVTEPVMASPVAPQPVYPPEQQEPAQVMDRITDLDDGSREIVIDGEKFKVTAAYIAAGLAKESIGFLNYLSRQVEIAIKMKTKMQELMELEEQSTTMA